MSSKRPVSSKKWLAAFFGTVLLLAVLVMGFNFGRIPSAHLATIFSVVEL